MKTREIMSKSNSYSKTLVELGASSSFDPDKLLPNTIQSSVSHINLLKRNGVPINHDALVRDTNKILNSLKMRNGKPVKDSYKLQIGRTVKRMFPDADVDLKRYNKSRSMGPTRISSPDFMRNMQKIINIASQMVQAAYTDIEDIGIYNTALVVLLSLSTSLRISELLQLRMSDLHSIETRRPLNIKTKGRRGARVLMANDLLLAMVNAIRMQRSNVEECMRRRVADNHSVSMIDRLTNEFIIICSESYMRRRLKELAAPVIDPRTLKSNILGFNTFRRVTTTLLVDNGEHSIAQAINNHSNMNTTLRHYNVQTTQASEDAFAEFDALRRSVLPDGLLTMNDVNERMRSNVEDVMMDYESDREEDTASRYAYPLTPPSSVAGNGKK